MLGHVSLSQTAFFFFLYSSGNFHLPLLKFVLLNLTQSPKSLKEKFNYTSIPLNNQHNEGGVLQQEENSTYYEATF